MALLEVFVHTGCLSEQRARSVALEIGSAYSQLHIRICPAQTHPRRISELDLLVLPSFVLDGKLLAVGVPRTGWLIHELQKHDLCESRYDGSWSKR